MHINGKDRIVPIIYVQPEPRKYPVMLQNKQSHELVKNTTTV